MPRDSTTRTLDLKRAFYRAGAETLSDPAGPIVTAVQQHDDFIGETQFFQTGGQTGFLVSHGEKTDSLGGAAGVMPRCPSPGPAAGA